MSAWVEQRPSGRYRGAWQIGRGGPGQRGSRTFDYAYQAEEWAKAQEAAALAEIDDRRSVAAVVDGATGTAPAPRAVGRPRVADLAAAPRAVVAPIAPATAPTAPERVPTLAEYGATYLDRRSADLEAATRTGYAHALGVLTRPVSAERAPLGAWPITEVSTDAVRDWKIDARNAAMAPTTWNRALKLARQIYLHAITDPASPVSGDPTRGVPLIPTGAPDDHVVTEAEESTLLMAAGPQLRAAVLIGLDCGLRWQETYALTPAAIRGDYLTVSRVIDRAAKTIRDYPKGKEPRYVPMTPRVAEAVAALAEDTEPGALLMPTLGRDGHPHTGGAMWDYNNHRSRQWAPLLAAIGAATITHRATGRIRRYDTEAGKAGEPIMQRRITPDWGFHQLRHTYGSRLADAGVPRHEIAALMGHSDEEITARYIHAGTDGRRRELVLAALARTA